MQHSPKVECQQVSNKEADTSASFSRQVLAMQGEREAVTGQVASQEGSKDRQRREHITPEADKLWILLIPTKEEPCQDLGPEQAPRILIEGESHVAQATPEAAPGGDPAAVTEVTLQEVSREAHEEVGGRVTVQREHRGNLPQAAGELDLRVGEES